LTTPLTDADGEETILLSVPTANAAGYGSGEQYYDCNQISLD
jgi:hypothetical protein